MAVVEQACTTTMPRRPFLRCFDPVPTVILVGILQYRRIMCSLYTVNLVAVAAHTEGLSFSQLVPTTTMMPTVVCLNLGRRSRWVHLRERYVPVAAVSSAKRRPPHYILWSGRSSTVRSGTICPSVHFFFVECIHLLAVDLWE